MQPLAGLVVIDFTRHLPGPFASRELLRLGARVVRVEAPEGDPLRAVAPGWDAILNAGKESVVCDLKAAPDLALALCDRADVVLDGFRPGVLEDSLELQVPERTVWCSITGFGSAGRHSRRADHDLNYLGWAGALADTAPEVPPVQVADLGAGALAAVAAILAALLERERTGRGTRVEISITHGAHRLVAHRLGGDPAERFLTGGLPCYRVYETADGRFLTVAALELKFWSRFCELLGRPDLVDRRVDPGAARDVAAEIAARPLREWLDLFDDEEVCAGPVWTLEQAAAEFGSPVEGRPPELGEHTEAWRRELGV